jgi:hypothetical protein
VPQLKKFSDFMDEPMDVGPPTEDMNKILELGTIVAEAGESVIVYVENPPLQKWSD